MSVKRVDYAGSAMANLQSLHDNPEVLDAEDALVVAGVAQAYATLALVEQQRIANRIALGMYTNADGSRAGQFAVTRITGMTTVEVHPEIREALGLS